MSLRFQVRHARNPLAGIQHAADGFPFEDCGNDRTRRIAGRTEGASSLLTTACLLIGIHAAVAVSLFGAKPSIHPDGSASIVVADFNGDGMADLAAASPAANTVALYIAAPDGSLPQKPTRLVSTGVEEPKETTARRQVVTVGDLDGDGINDLIVANTTAGKLSVLRGRGDGQFAAAVVEPTLPLPTGLALGDFNGDSKPDLAIVSQGTNTVSIWLGSGDGRFSRAGQIPVGHGPTSIVTGDFGTSEKEPARDGKLDLAVTATGDGQIDVLFGDGAGGFSGPVTFDALGATAIVAADFNGDGVLDLVTAAPSTGEIVMTIGLSSGTVGCFANGMIVANLAPALQPTALVAVDLNHDGNLDLVATVAGTSESGTLTYINHPRPHMRAVFFEAPTLCRTGGTPAAVVGGEVGKSTAVAVADRNVSHVSVLLAGADGALANCDAPRQLGEPLDASGHVAVSRTIDEGKRSATGHHPR